MCPDDDSNDDFDHHLPASPIFRTYTNRKQDKENAMYHGWESWLQTGKRGYLIAMVGKIAVGEG
jgi:hypothetical protein